MYQKQLSDHEVNELSSSVSVQYQGDSLKGNLPIISEKEDYSPSKEAGKNDYCMTKSDWAAFICYLASLIIWFYSIYLNQKEAPDLQENSRNKSKRHDEVMNDVFDEFNKEEAEV